MKLENNKYYRKFRVFAWVPVIWIIRLIRPLVCIRFGGLFSERIGHFAVETDMYLCQKALGQIPPRTIDLFFHQKAVPGAPVSNLTLLGMFKKKMFIHPIFELLWKANHCAGGDGSAHFVNVPKSGSFLQRELLNAVECQVEFTKEQIKEGEAFLKSIGVGDCPFVCVHCRDSAYLKKHISGVDWGYHDFRDSVIDSYVPAMEALVEKGYYILRMGAVVDSSFEVNCPQIIDYARLYRTDFLDIFLSSQCEFFLGSDSGLSQVPMIFRKKTVLTNFCSINNAICLSKDVIFVPKKVWSDKKNRCLTYKEVVENKIGSFVRSEDFIKHNLRTINNSSEEIKDVALEAARLCHEDTLGGQELLQKKFWDIFRELNYDKEKQDLARLSCHFVRSNIDLF